MISDTDPVNKPAAPIPMKPSLPPSGYEADDEKDVIERSETRRDFYPAPPPKSPQAKKRKK